MDIVVNSRGAGAGDPVAERRARIAKVVKTAKRVGYGALLVAIVAFGAAVATGYPPALVGIAVAGLGAFCLIAPVPIILGYGVRAATREERGAPSH